MTASFLISKAANEDIQEAVTYIAQENKKAAHTFVDALYDSLAMLADNPLMGHTREGITQHPVRFWTFKWHYMIIYTPTDPLQVVRVLSGQRDLPLLI